MRPEASIAENHPYGNPSIRVVDIAGNGEYRARISRELGAAEPPLPPTRKEITPLELRQQLIECVDVLAWPGDAQMAWLEEHGFPATEMAEQYIDAVPGWFPRLRAHGLLGPDAEQALIALSDFLLSFLQSSDDALWEDSAVRSDPAWNQIRERARITCQTLAADAEGLGPGTTRQGE